MKQFLSKRIPRVFAATLATVFLLSFALGSTSSPTSVTDEATLRAALATAASGDTVIFDAGVASITLNGGVVSLPSGVTLNLNGGTLTLNGGTVLDASGIIANGTVNVANGTLLREGSSSITASVAVGSSGDVRGPQVLTLENLDTTSGESISYITYTGESGRDDSSYVTRAATATVYLQMTGSNSASYKVVETVVTDAGHVFRLGTRNTSTLSLEYLLSYAGLSGASLTALNPSSYTASDTAITLNNPTKDGYNFDGWTCITLGATTPTTSMVIPEGTSGDLTFVANWTELPQTGGMNSKSGGTASGTTDTAADSETTDDAESQQEQAAAADSAATQSTRRTKVASSSTKVTFTSDVDAVVPTLENVRGESFPWGWVLGGLAALGGLAWLLAKAIERKRR